MKVLAAEIIDPDPMNIWVDTPMPGEYPYDYVYIYDDDNFPQTSISSGDVSWSTSSGAAVGDVFEVDTEYVAKITVTAATGHYFDSAPNAPANFEDFADPLYDPTPIFISNNGTTLVFKYVFPAVHVGAIEGDISDPVTVAGRVGQPVSGATNSAGETGGRLAVEMYLPDSEMLDLLYNSEEVFDTTSWFLNMPTGLSSSTQVHRFGDPDLEQLVTFVLSFYISGTPTEASNEAVRIRIPAAYNWLGEPLDVPVNPYVTFNITAAPSGVTELYTLIVENGSGDGTGYYMPQIVPITADPAAVGKVFDRWELTEGYGTIADPSSASTTFMMARSNATVTAHYKDAPASPKTGDHSHTALWFTLLALGITGIGILTAAKKKKRID
jgi:hypothetical protein